MSDGSADAAIDRLVELRFDQDLNLLIIVEHLIERLNQSLVDSTGLLLSAQASPRVQAR